MVILGGSAVLPPVFIGKIHSVGLLFTIFLLDGYFEGPGDGFWLISRSIWVPFRLNCKINRPWSPPPCIWAGTASTEMSSAESQCKAKDQYLCLCLKSCIQGTHRTGYPQNRVPTEQGTHRTGYPQNRVPTEQGTHRTGYPQNRVPTEQGKWFYIFPFRENTGNFKIL